ncbi:MAG: glycosyltransferase family 4 protein [Clostridiales bacterium]|jgi:1,2-diacylglycerol 3-alpha-glucosyltransferase|nr:glycosyltransferase family 4 protein [Clostridiales bacterium]
MNIGIFTDTYYPQINGVVTSIRMLEKELNKFGHTVYIITTTDPDATHAVPRVFRMPSMPFVFLPTHRLTILYSPKLIVNLRKLHLDVVHTQTEFPVGIFGKLVAEFFRIPMVHTYHTMYEDYVHYIANGHLITPKMAQQYSRVFCNGADLVIAPVEKAKRCLEQYGVKRPTYVIPTGLDFEPFRKDNFTPIEINAVKKELGIAPNEKVILSIGRVSKEKSIDVLINAMPKLISKINAKLVIMGPGPYTEVLKEQANALGVRGSVIFAGGKPREIIPLYYQIGDVFATASTSETQGLTYVEAMASEIPVIVKRDPSFENVVINGKTGLWFERDSECADVLYYALTHEEETRQMAITGLSSIENLSARRFAQSVEQVYAESMIFKQPKRHLFILPSLKKKNAQTDDVDTTIIHKQQEPDIANR